MKKIIFLIAFLILLFLIVSIALKMEFKTTCQKELQEINSLFEQDMRGEIELSDKELEKLILEFNSCNL